MNWVVLRIILRLGRYAVLPVVALACVILAVWLMAMDRYTITALVTAPIVFSTFLGALALAIGLLLLPSRKHREFEANEETAPGLWAMWRKLDPSFVRSRRTLLINTDFNASIGEVRRYGGLFGQHVLMTVGLPMLIVLDEPAVRAIVAHEVAHAQLRHTSGKHQPRGFHRGFGERLPVRQSRMDHHRAHSPGAAPFHARMAREGISRAVAGERAWRRSRRGRAGWTH